MLIQNLLDKEMRFVYNSVEYNLGPNETKDYPEVAAKHAISKYKQFFKIGKDGSGPVLNAGNVSPIVTSDTPAPSVNACEFCQRTFDSPNGLKIHVARSHK